MLTGVSVEGAPCISKIEARAKNGESRMMPGLGDRVGEVEWLSEWDRI
jgi:hypothetical protein